MVEDKLKKEAKKKTTGKKKKEDDEEEEKTNLEKTVEIESNVKLEEEKKNKK